MNLSLQVVPSRQRGWRKKQRVKEDPVVGYDLSHYFYDKVLLTVRVSSLSEAQQYVGHLPGGGPYTLGDINFRPVRKSEWARRYPKDGW